MTSTARDASEERTVHRFEAFSDIVIGFSLAQLGARLVIPEHGIDLFTDPGWLVAFLWAFAMICAMWWFHHRIFSTIFVPKTSPVLINFVWLAVVVLCVYDTQILVHLPNDPVVWRLYFVLFALAYGLLALQYRIGIAERGAQLAPEARLAARRQCAFMALWTAPFALGAIAMTVLHWGYVLVFAIWPIFIITAIASTLLARHYRKLAAQEASRPDSVVGQPTG